MKRKILWKRVLILVGGVFALILLLFVALFTLVIIALLLYSAVAALEYFVLAWRRAI